MTDQPSLLDRLRTAERGSPELSAEVLTVVTRVPHWVEEGAILCGEPRSVPLSVTESLDAAWALALAAGFFPSLDAEFSYDSVPTFRCALWEQDGEHHYAEAAASRAHTPALAICAALVAAREGGR